MGETHQLHGIGKPLPAGQRGEVSQRQELGASVQSALLRSWHIDLRVVLPVAIGMRDAVEPTPRGRQH